MTLFLLGLTIYLSIVILFQTGMVTIYRRWLGRAKFTDADCSVNYSPKVAIVLTVRGHDPSLRKCLLGLANQEYSGEFRIHVIVDHTDDACCDPIDALVTEIGDANFELSIAEPPSFKCSLKCDRLVQVISELSDDNEIICLIDSDTIPDRKWLSSLVAPLQDNSIAAASGNRWFHPQTNGVEFASGNMIRYLWNSAAIVQMYAYGIAWGGSLAIRHAAIKDTGLLDKWRRSMFDDVMINDHFRSHDQRLVSIPELLLKNEESVSSEGARNWIRRQLLDARLYHRCWPLVLTHAISSTLLWLLLLSLTIFFAISAAWVWLAWSIALVSILYFTNTKLLIDLEKSATANINRRLEWLGEPTTTWLNTGRIIGIAAGVLPVQAVFFVSAMWATFTRNVEWRQTKYVINDKQDIRLVDYLPFESEAGEEGKAASIE